MIVVIITHIVCLSSILFCVRHVGVKHHVPDIATRSVIAQVVAVVMVMMRGVTDKGKDTDWTPCEMVT